MVKPEMVKIPEGVFLYGEEKGEIHLPTYWIGKYPVTNREYLKFFVESVEIGWSSPNYRKPEYAKHPATHVSWYDAVAYCEWLSEKTGREFRLPTEQEWEKAARGVDGREYPWGNEWKDGMCNTGESGIGDTTPVGQFSPAGDSPYGVADMAGNVWEWTDSWWSDMEEYKVVRGGAWFNCVWRARCAVRGGSVLVSYFDHIGFRVVST